MTHSQTGVKHEKNSTDVRTFFDSQRSHMDAAGVVHAAADDGRDALASSPSRPMIAAALARRLGRVGRRLATPNCLAVTGSSREVLTPSLRSSKKSRQRR